MNEIRIHYAKGYLYADNFGNKVEYPEYCEKILKRLHKLQKKAARQVEGSKNRQETLRKIQDAKRTIKAQMYTLIGKVSNDLLCSYASVVVEPAEEDFKWDGEGINYVANYKALRKRIRQKQEQYSFSQNLPLKRDCV